MRSDVARVAGLLLIILAFSHLHALPAESVCFDEDFREQVRSVAGQVVGEEEEWEGRLTGEVSIAALDAQVDGELLNLIIQALSARVVRDPTAVAARTLETVGDVGEVIRRDKQVGAPSGSNGTTTLAERAAFPLIMGLAVEHGAVQQKQDGTSLTLSSSPYALMVLAHEDNSTLYQRNWLARMFSVSGNFLLEDAGAGLNGLEAENLASLTAKVTFGDRSTRSAYFQNEIWAKKAKPIFQDMVDRELTILETCAPTTESPAYRKKQAMWRPGAPYRTRLTAYVSSGAYLTAEAEARRDGLAAEMEAGLCDEISADAETLSASCDVALITEERAVIAELNRRGRAELTRLVEAFQRSQALYSLTYSWNRIHDGSDYSEVKLIGDGLLPWTKLPLQPVVNAAVSFNHEPDAMLDQETIRDFSATLSLASTMMNPLAGAFGDPDPFSKVGFSLSAAYRRLNGIDKNLATIQANFQLPLAAGFSLPLSLTYSSRTETDGNDEFKVNVGGLFDTERLLALLDLGVI